MEGFDPTVIMAVTALLMPVIGAFMAITPYPVSYTHLDVYKRQGPRSRVEFAPGDVRAETAAPGRKDEGMTRYGMAIDLRRCAGCGACVVACQMQNNQRPGVSWNNLDVYEWGTQAGESGRAYVPNACVQCEKPACVDACPTGASVRRDDGITVIDYEKCIACGLCLAACPYGARKLNRTSENMFGADVPAPYRCV